MITNYLEEQFLKKKLFINEEILEISYLPEQLLHREQELIMLSKIFIKLIENPFKISRKVLIQGDIGIGKTAIAIIFSRMLLRSANRRNLNIRSVHINCRKEKTHYKILHQILTKLDFPIPKRGFSPQELISMLQDFLISEHIYLFLILDEMNHIQTSNYDLIYSLTRLNESSNKENIYLSLLYIVRDITLLRNLDESTISTLQGNILSLNKYTKNQIVEILKFRVNISIKTGVLSDTQINFIADKISESGDIRKGLNIIRNSVKNAEVKEQFKVSTDDIKSAMKNIIPSLHDDAINFLNIHQIILFYSISSCLLENKEKELSILQIKTYYDEICKNYDEIPKRNTQLWQYLQTLKNLKLISIKTRSKNLKGRKSFISVENIPIQILNEEINQKLRNIKK